MTHPDGLTGAAAPEPFLFGEATDPHQVGSTDCDACWKGPFHCDCGGLIHYEFGDESWDGYWLYSKCDQCGGSADD